MSYTPYKQGVFASLATLAALSIGPASARAQTLAPGQSRAPSTVPALPLPPAGEPSPDTGRMRPTHVDWARYDGPAMCLAASRNVQHLADRRGLTPIRDERLEGTLWDTLAYDPALDTLSTAARAATRACLARFQVSGMTARELNPFVQAALRAGDDTRALAAVDRQLALAAPAGPRAQADVLRAAIFSLLDAHPPRVQTVATLVARLDALGAAAHIPRLFAHQTLFTYYVRQAADVAAAKRELAAVRALELAITPDDLTEGTLSVRGGSTLLSEMALVNWDDPRGLEPYVTERVAALERAKTNPGIIMMFRRVSQAYAQTFVAPLGKRVPTVRANYLFTPGVSAAPAALLAGDSAPASVEVRVRPGRVTFWLVAPEDWRENLPATRKFATSIRQLRARYGDSVDIVVFTRTMGYTPGSLVQQPTEEAEAIRKYFLEFRHLPATLAVSVASVTTLPDGTRQRGPVPYDPLFSAGGIFSAHVVVVARDGTFARLFQELQPSTALYHALDLVVGARNGGEATR